MLVFSRFLKLLAFALMGLIGQEFQGEQQSPLLTSETHTLLYNTEDEETVRSIPWEEGFGLAKEAEESLWESRLEKEGEGEGEVADLLPHLPLFPTLVSFIPGAVASRDGPNSDNTGLCVSERSPFRLIFGASVSERGPPIHT